MEKQITLAPDKVQELVSGAFANNGFILVADTELDDRFNYKSSDAGVSANRPKLVVQYTLPQGRLPSSRPPVAQAGAKALFAPAPQGELLTYTSQLDGITGTDTFLQSTSPATNFGTDGGLRVGESNAGVPAGRRRHMGGCWIPVPHSRFHS